MRIHPTRSVPVAAPLPHFGYRVLLPDHPGDGRALLTALDVLLVRARRRARLVVWHHGGDDLHLLRSAAGGDGSTRYPGIAATARAWDDRGHREPGTARCVDTAVDLGPDGLVSDTAAAHDLDIAAPFAGPRRHPHAQHAYAALAGARVDYTPRELAVSALSSAVMTALLGGLYAGRLRWDRPLGVLDLLENVAWDLTPSPPGGAPAPVPSPW